MTHTGNTLSVASSPEEETEAAGGEDIYGADGDAGTARPEDPGADTTDPVRADSGTGTTPEEEEDSSGG